MEIKPYCTGDEQQILSLFQKSFGKILEERYWIWRYKNNPYTEDVMVHMMWDGNTLAGHYAVSPIEMIIHGQAVMTALSMTTMTHPEYWGRGIFTKLADSLYRTILTDNDIKAVWGFPNANSHYGFIKNLSWKDIATIPFLTKKIEKEAAKKALSFQVETKFTGRHVKILKECITGKTVFINKTLNYLNWRYVQNPSFKYHVITVEKDGIDALVVFKIIKSLSYPGYHEADILELGTTADYSVVDYLLSSVISFAADKGYNLKILNTWLSLSDKRHIILEKAGFKLAQPTAFLSYTSFDTSIDALGTYSNWDLTMGYSDVF